MTEPEELDEDLFADLYEGDDVPTQSTQEPAVSATNQDPTPAQSYSAPPPDLGQPKTEDVVLNGTVASHVNTDRSDVDMNMNGISTGANQHATGYAEHDENYGPIIKEDG